MSKTDSENDTKIMDLWVWFTHHKFTHKIGDFKRQQYEIQDSNKNDQLKANSHMQYNMIVKLPSFGLLYHHLEDKGNRKLALHSAKRSNVSHHSKAR